MRLLGSDEGKEHVKGHLDRVDKDQTVLGGDELEVDCVHNGPDLPRTLAGREQIVLDFVDNDADAVSVAESQIGEKDSHENGAPNELVKGDLGGHVLGVRSFDLFVEPVVKVVSRGAVVQETKGRESDETLPVKGSSRDKDLLMTIERRLAECWVSEYGTVMATRFQSCIY